jgi:hypothetical protein
MNYTDIINTSLSYSDRANSDEIQANMDNFLRIVEAKVNRKLQTRNQSKRAQIVLTADTEYYALPSDFAGLRSIFTVVETERKNFDYVTPEKMNVHITNNLNEYVYTIMGNSLQIHPTFDDTILQIMYYQRVTPLTATNDTNWLSNYAPDAYIFGTLCEINYFVKDVQTAGIWETRFNLIIDDIDLEDAKDRWSGPPPVIRTS